MSISLYMKSLFFNLIHKLSQCEKMTFPEDPTESVVKSVGFTNYTKEITIELENRDVIHLHAAADCCSESFFVIIDNPDKLVGCKLLYLMETTPKESGQDVSGYGGTPVGITDYTVDTTGLSNRNNDCSTEVELRHRARQ